MQFFPQSLILSGLAQQRLFDSVRLDGPVEVFRPPRMRTHRVRKALAGSLGRAAKAIAPSTPRPAV